MQNLFDKASLVMVPSGYDNGKLYNIKPEDKGSAFEFERGSAATRVNSSGLIEAFDSSKYDTPRIDYTSGEGALLLEPQRTNLVTYSEDFTQFTKNNVTLVGGYSAPDGKNTAYKVSGDSTSSLTFSLGLSGTETRTIWAKTVSGTGQLNLTSHNANTNNLFTITENWERFEVNGTTSTSGRAFFYAVAFRGSSTLTEVIIWGAQVEQGSYATSYIPTNGQTETRLADVCQGGGDASVFNDSEGTLYLEYEPEKDLQMVSLSNGTQSESIWIYLVNAGASLSVYAVSGGGQVASINCGTYESITANSGIVKVAATYKTNQFKAFVNGSLVATDTSGATPVGLNTVEFKYPTSSAYNTKAKIKSLYYFPEVLTDTELQQLTSNT